MKPGPPPIVFRLLLGAMVVLAVVGLDFGLTRLHHRLILPPPVHPIFPREKNPIYHHGLRPSSEGWLFYGPLKSYYFSNSLGFRDGKIREVPLDTPGKRVLLIGDSFTEGVGLGWEDTFAGILAKDLAPEGVEVLNAGVNSYCPVLMRLKLRHFIKDRGLRVDRVILFVDNSDIVDEHFYDVGPDGGVIKIQYGPFESRSRGMVKIDNLSNWMKTHLEANFSLLGVLSRNLRLFVRRHDTEGIAAFEKFVELKRHWPDHRGNLEDLIGRGLAEAKREMTGIAEMLKANGIPMTLVIYPWPEQIRSGTRPSRVEREWSAWARENQVSLINLFPVFVNGTPADEVIRKYYIPGDFHWSPEGNARVAGEVLRQGNFVRSGPSNLP